MNTRTKTISAVGAVALGATAAGTAFVIGMRQKTPIVLDAVRSTPDILSDPAPQVRVAELGDFAVQLDVLFWIDPPIKREALEAVDHVLERVKPALQQAGVDLPFPTSQVLLHDQTETTDGDRSRQREGWPARGENPPSRWSVPQERGKEDGA